MRGAGSAQPSNGVRSAGFGTTRWAIGPLRALLLVLITPMIASAALIRLAAPALASGQPLSALGPSQPPLTEEAGPTGQRHPAECRWHAAGRCAGAGPRRGRPAAAAVE